MKQFITIHNQPIIDLTDIHAIIKDNDTIISFYDKDGDVYVTWDFESEFTRNKVYEYLQKKYCTYIDITDIEGLDKLNSEELFERI